MNVSEGRLTPQVRAGLSRIMRPIQRKDLFMRTKLVVLSLVLPFSGMLMSDAASAEPYKGTWEQQMACTPDVWRLCGSAIPDVDRIVACLRQNTPSLSDGRRAVVGFNNRLEPQQPGASR